MHATLENHDSLHSRVKLEVAPKQESALDRVALFVST